MYVYKIKNKLNGKVYIGITSRTIQERFLEHYYKRNERKHLHLYSAIIKYGIESFELELVEVCSSLKELFNKEIYWIRHYNSNIPEKGYNNTSGGEGFKPLEIDEELMFELYKKTRSSVLVAKELECSENTILRRLKKYIKTDRGMTLITPSVIELYQNPYTIKDICSILDISNKTVMKILDENNIERHTFYKSVPEMEEIFRNYLLGFSINDLERAYKIPRHRLSRLINYKLKI